MSDNQPSRDKQGAMHEQYLFDNRVLLLGNIQKEPEIRQHPHGKEAILLIGVPDRDEVTGYWETRSAHFIYVRVLCPRMVEFIGRHDLVGRKVRIAGRIENWQTAEGDMLSTQIVLRPDKGYLALLEAEIDTEGATPEDAVDLDYRIWVEDFVGTLDAFECGS